MTNPAPWRYEPYPTYNGRIRYTVLDRLGGIIASLDQEDDAAAMVVEKNEVAANYIAEIELVIARFQDAIAARDEEIATMRRRWHDEVKAITRDFYQANAYLEAHGINPYTGRKDGGQLSVFDAAVKDGAA